MCSDNNFFVKKHILNGDQALENAYLSRLPIWGQGITHAVSVTMHLQTLDGYNILCTFAHWTIHFVEDIDFRLGMQNQNHSQITQLFKNFQLDSTIFYRSETFSHFKQMYVTNSFTDT